MSIFVYLYVTLVIIFGVCHTAKTVYSEISLRRGLKKGKKPKSRRNRVK